jgi:hypothetical protein
MAIVVPVLVSLSSAGSGNRVVTLEERKALAYILDLLWGFTYATTVLLVGRLDDPLCFPLAG